AEVVDLLLAAGLPEPDPVHRRVVLDHGEGEPGVLDLLPVERERLVVPRQVDARLAPVEEPAREDADGLLDANLPQDRPERGRPLVCPMRLAAPARGLAAAAVARTAASVAIGTKYRNITLTSFYAAIYAARGLQATFGESPNRLTKPELQISDSRKVSCLPDI